MSEADPSAGAETSPPSASSGASHLPMPRSFRLAQVWSLIGMLALALAGLGVSQAAPTRAWGFWLFAVLVYGGVGIWHSAVRARCHGVSVRPDLRKQVLHWGTLLVTVKVVLLLQYNQILSGEAASDCALLLLALACCQAGVHFDSMFAVVGIVLLLMTVALAMTQKFAFLMIVLLAGVALGIYLMWTARRKESSEDGGPPAASPAEGADA